MKILLLLNKVFLAILVLMMADVVTTQGPTVKTLSGETTLVAGKDVVVIAEGFEPDKEIFIAIETKADGTGQNLRQIDLFTGADGGASGYLPIPSSFAGRYFLRARQYGLEGKEAKSAYLEVEVIGGAGAEPPNTSETESEGFDLPNTLILGISSCFCLVILLTLTIILLVVWRKRHNKDKE